MSQREGELAILASINDARATLRSLIDRAEAPALADKPKSGEWSPLENVRHLLFAEQLHLGKFLPERQPWSALGLTPHFLANEEAFRAVGSQPPADLAQVWSAWDDVHAPLRDACTGANDELLAQLQRNLKHLLGHIKIIESLLHRTSRGRAN